MTTVFPGTTIEVSKIEQGSSRQLFDGIFVTGGITLSQVSIMTGLEPYLVQNWVKRGFLAPPHKRVYSRGQFARIIIINMLREALKIEDICLLIRVIGGETDSMNDDLVFDDELYHGYVDMIARGNINIHDPSSVAEASSTAAQYIEERIPGTRKTLAHILQIMFYAHSASRICFRAYELLGTLK